MKIFGQFLSLLGIFSIIAAGLFLLNLVSVNQIEQWTNLATTKTINAPTPTPAQLQKILEASIDQACQLNININQNISRFPTNFDTQLAKCDQYTLARLSQDGQYVAFEDLSAKGIDSLVKIFTYKNQKVVLLHDLDKYSILDFSFLPSGKLAVLASDGLKGKQLIYVYDLAYLFSQYPQEAEEGEFSSRSIKLATGELAIATNQKRAAYLKLADQEIQVFAEDGEKPLLSFSLETLN